MSRIKLDLSKFKYQSGDDKTSTLRHKDGHTVTIMHRALGKDAQDQLSALNKIPEQSETAVQKQESVAKMADGGPTPGASPDPMVSRGETTGTPRGNTSTRSDEEVKHSGAKNNINGADVSQPSTWWSEGGKVAKYCMYCGGMAHGGECYAEGGEVNPKLEQSKKVPPEQPTLNYHDLRKDYAKKNRNQYDKDGRTISRKMYARGGGPEAVSSDEDNSQPIDIQANDQAIQAPSDGVQVAPMKVDTTKMSNAELQQLSNIKALQNQQNDRYSRATGMDPSTGQQIAPPALPAYADPAIKYKEQMEAWNTRSQLLKENGMPPDSQPPEPPSEVQNTVQGADSAGRSPAGQPNQPGLAGGLQQPIPNDMTSGIGMQMQGNNLIAQGQSGLAGATAEYQQDVANAQVQYKQQRQQDMDMYNTVAAPILADREKLNQELLTKQINPSQYIDNMSTGKAIRSGLGLILGGMGAGLTGGPNMALEFLNKQIDRDLDAQKATMANKQTLLGHNIQELGDARQGYLMTKMQTNDMLNAELEQKKNETQSGALKNYINMIQGGKLKENGGLQQQLIMMRMLQGGMSPGGGSQAPVGSEAYEQQFQQRMRGMEMMGMGDKVKYAEAHHVPYVGEATGEVPDPVRNKLSAFKNVDRLFQEASDLSHKSAIQKLSPVERNRADTLMNELQSNIRTAEDQGVYKKSEADYMRETIGKSPASLFSAINSEPKLRELQTLKQNQHKDLLNQYHLPTDSVGHQRQGGDNNAHAALQWAKSNPNDPRAAKILQRLGQ